MKNQKKLLCNVCGKELTIEQDILKEDCLSVEKEWGYFSDKDLELHRFHICESCYDTFIKSFKIPVEIVEKETVFSEE